LKKIFHIKIERKQEFHRKLGVLRANNPVSIHLNLENKQLIGQPLRKLFGLLREHMVVSRMYHHGEIITPTPDTMLTKKDVLLIVASKKEIEQLKLMIGH
jgi:putative transport protein